MKNEDRLGEIIIAPNNTMGAQYAIKALGHSSTSVEITVSVPQDSDIKTEITIRVDDYNQKDTEIDVKYRKESSVLVEIQPVGHVETGAEITVRPGNRMWALYAIEEPPELERVFTPVADSFTRGRDSFQAVNYGGFSSLTVGRAIEDDFNSYLRFDLDDFDRRFKLINTKLRLHYSGVIPKDAQLELYVIDEYWNEYGITRLNQPRVESMIIDKYTNNEQERHVTFEVTETVQEWLDDTQENYGIMVGLAEDSPDTVISFRSRESNRPPELIVTYFDTRIYSAGRSRVNAELFVWNVGNSNTLAEIEVASAYGFSSVMTELYVHRYEVPLLTSVNTEITVTRGQALTEIVASIPVDEDRLTEISARVGLDDRTPTEITVSKQSVFTEIYVSHHSHVDTEVTVQRHDSSDKLTELTVTRQSVAGEIYVKHQSTVGTEITVVRDELESHDTEITVTRDRINSEIYIRAVNDSVSDTEIYSRAIGFNSHDTEITATRETTLAEITVTKHMDKDAEIYVKYTDTVDTELTVTVFNQILAEIDVVVFSQHDTEITVTKPYTYATITVPYWKDNDINTEIMPRILRVDDVYTEIIVRGLGKAYVFII